MPYELVRRPQRHMAWLLLAPFVATALAVLASSLIFAALGKPVGTALHALLVEPFLSWGSFSEILLRTGPLLLIAQGLAIGFRANVFNIGAEGQFVLGAIFASSLPVMDPMIAGWWVWPAMMLAGALGGAAWAAIAAFWRVRLNASEILVTLMLSFVAVQVLNYLLLGPWKDPAGFNFPQSVMFPPDAMLPTLLAGTRVNVSLLFGVAATFAFWLFMQRMFGGYRLVVGGLAPQAARYAGFAQSRAVWLSLLIGGACAGLAGAAEVAGPLGQLQRSIASGYGYGAIIVAYVGGLHPFGIAVAAFLLSAVAIGGDNALVAANLPNASVTVFEGLLLAFYLATAALAGWQVRRKAPRARVAA